MPPRCLVYEQMRLQLCFVSVMNVHSSCKVGPVQMTDKMTLPGFK
jgi:hypothetical protein